MTLDPKSKKQKQSINFHLKFSFDMCLYTPYNLQTPNLDVRVLQAHFRLYPLLLHPINPTHWIIQSHRTLSHLCAFISAVLSRCPSSSLTDFELLHSPLSPIQLLSWTLQLLGDLWLLKPHLHFVCSTLLMYRTFCFLFLLFMTS